MSDSKKFDAHIKESFGNYTPEVPSHIWDNIAAGRKRKKPAAFWLNRKLALGVGVLLVVLATGGLLLIKNNETKIIAHENNASSKQGTVISVPPAAVKDNTSIKAAPGNSTITTTDAKKENIPTTAGNNRSSTDNTVNSIPSSSNDGNSNANTDEKSNTVDPGKNASKKKSKSKLNAVAATGAEIATGENTENLDEPVQQDFLPSRSLYSAEKLTAASLVDPNSKKTDFKAILIPCPEKDAAGNKQYWEVYAGPDYVFKKYNDTANSLLLEKRKESTSFQSAFSAGVRYTRVFNNGMSVRAGVNYSQINEKFSYAQGNVIQLTYEINQAGDTINSYYVRGTKYKTTYNHYRTIDIPLMVGYELGNGRLHTNINAGAVINIYSWQNGETLDTSYAPVSFTSDKLNSAYQYKSNIGVGFMGAVSFYYKLNDRLHLLAEPYYRYNFSPMNKEVLSIQEKFSTMGLRLGLRVDLY